MDATCWVMAALSNPEYGYDVLLRRGRLCNARDGFFYVIRSPHEHCGAQTDPIVGSGAKTRPPKSYRDASSEMAVRSDIVRPRLGAGAAKKNFGLPSCEGVEMVNYWRRGPVVRPASNLHWSQGEFPRRVIFDAVKMSALVKWEPVRFVGFPVTTDLAMNGTGIVAPGG
mgnify:CR=1 FL=1